MSLGRQKLTHTRLAQGGPLDVPELKGKRVAVPLCGGNIDITVLGRVIERGLAADRRLVRFAVTVFFSMHQRLAGGWGGEILTALQPALLHEVLRTCCQDASVMSIL